MARKIFVSYKHSDNNVANLRGYYSNTARDYVDYLIENLLDNEIYKGEGDEDLSKFKNDTIKTHLKDKIHNSSVTLVLISPNMKALHKKESDQWMPWEISYSLKEITRSDKMSHSNAIIVIVLPDSNGDYSYYINKCDEDNRCNVRNLNTNFLFQILKNNMFNYKSDDNETYDLTCQYCSSTNSRGNSSYITSVKWSDFISNKNDYLEKAIEIRDNRKKYNIVKEIL